MNKIQLVDAIAKEANISKVMAKKALDAVLSVTMKTLKENDKISLVGFGTFSMIHKPARLGRNPRTGESIKIPPKKAVKFKAGNDLNMQID